MDTTNRLVPDGQLQSQIATLISNGSQGLLQSALDVLPISIAVVDAEGVTIAVNAACQRYVLETQGRSWQPGTSFAERLDSCPATEVSRALRASLPALLSGEMQVFERTYEVEFAGQTRVKQLRMVRFVFGDEPLLVMTHEDITNITSAHREVDVLSQQLLDSQDDERRRIARELHDSTSQHLVATSLALNSLRAAQEKADTPLVPRASAALADATVAVGEAQKEIRLLSFLMHPPNLERDGLAVALRAFINGFSRRSGLKCTLRVRGLVEGLDPEMQRSLFRVSQEALINVHRHADASGAAVSLARIRQDLVLIVRDDGHGARGILDDQGDNLGVGIPGMRARLRQLGGRLEIVDSPRGLTVKAIVPLNAARPLHPFVLGSPRPRAPRRIGRVLLGRIDQAQGGPG
jgi:two-component system NarL family sensor kinase